MIKTIEHKFEIINPMADILSKIKKAGITGRGGANFPTADKWKMVKEAESDHKYVVCNCSEGEPGVKKDGFLIERHADKIVDGMRLALEYLSVGSEVKGIFYLNPAYYEKYKKLLEKEISKAKVGIELFKKPHSAGYIGGEETSALNVIEGKKAEPRLRPPFPTIKGLYGKPTLVNNVETFYDVSLADKDIYKKTRFYTITGDVVFGGVYEFPQDMNIGLILKKTHNLPDFPFFVQVGGDGSGAVWSDKQLKQAAVGAGSIHVYSIQKYKPQELILKWLDFFRLESCGQCTPCREGTYRLKEALTESKVDWNTVADLLSNLDETAFCGLGGAVSNPIKSYIKNVLEPNPESKVNLPIGAKKIICSCF